MTLLIDPAALNVIMTVFSLVLGLVIGSFLNVCIYRIPLSISVAKGRSFCPSCGAPVRAYDNIPLISYLILRGKCRDCNASISPRYPIVELLCSLGFLLCWLRFGLAWETVLFWVFAASLITLAFIDLDTQEIPDRFHFMILGLGIAAIFLTDNVTLPQRFIGAAAISVPMLVIALVTNGFGMGDVKLMAASGFLLGWKVIVFSGLLGCVLAAVIAGLLIVTGRKTRKDKISFGPYLAIALFIGALYGQDIINAYLGLFSL